MLSKERRRAADLAKKLYCSHYALPGRPQAPWRVVSCELVSAPTPPSLDTFIALSLLDAELYQDACSSGGIFFEQALAGEAMRATLGTALETYPVLAGRLRCVGGRVGVACNNAGVAYTVLSAPAVALPRDRGCSVEGRVLPPFPHMWQGYGVAALLRSQDGVMDVLQVDFQSGSMLHVCVNHAVADGISLAAFIAHWAMLAAGFTKEQLPVPLLDRTVFDEACGIQRAPASAGRGGGVWCCGAPAVTPAASSAEPAVKEQHGRISPLGGIRLFPTGTEAARLLLRAVSDSSMGLLPGKGAAARLVIHFPKALLAALKSELSTAAAPLSSNDVATALVWRAMALSRRCRGVLDRSGRPGGVESISLVANTRGHLLTEEQEMYIGNATVFTTAKLPVEAMRGEGGLAAAAAAIRSAKAALDPTSIQREMSFVAAHAQAGRRVLWNMVPGDGHAVTFDWAMSNALDTQFGRSRAFCFEAFLGAPRSLPYFLSMLAAPRGDGLHVTFSVPADESDACLAQLRGELQARQGKATAAVVNGS
jgi:Transferase family